MYKINISFTNLQQNVSQILILRKIRVKSFKKYEILPLY